MHCNYEYFCELQKAANDLIKIVDIAPEEPGAMNFIDKVKDNVVVSIAHTARIMILRWRQFNMV